jgi:hypothetical protein
MEGGCILVGTGVLVTPVPNAGRRAESHPARGVRGVSFVGNPDLVVQIHRVEPPGRARVRQDGVGQVAQTFPVSQRPGYVVVMLGAPHFHCVHSENSQP